MILRRDFANSRAAEFSDCETYRYRLRYELNDGNVLAPPTKPIAFVMLNPSTANEITPDPTVRRCMSFAAAWGYSTLLVANLFALRATDPRELARHADPIGPENDAVLAALIDSATPIVAAWGAHPMAYVRAPDVLRLGRARDLCCLGTTASGSPRHPLYVPKSTALQPWRLAA